MNRTRSGFTLIELSIVLVIIGLIVGGVLVGQDLIKGAEIRAQVSQFEKYDAAANAFRNKYGGLPGDINNPGNFGFDNGNLTSNGNGRIDRGNSNNTSYAYEGEAAAFFRHLSQANLIADNIVSTANFSEPFPNSTASDVTDLLPESKLANAQIFSAAISGLNYYFIFRGAYPETTFELFLPHNEALPEIRVIDAFQIDSKMDDGLGTSGRVRGVNDFITSDTTGDCFNATTGVYATAASVNETTCSLRVRTSF